MKNSLSKWLYTEGAYNKIDYDLKNLRDQDFKKAYGGKTKDQVRKELGQKGDRQLLNDDDEEIVEATEGLSGKSLVDHLSSICLSTWYGITGDFKAKPDVFDIHPDQSHENYNVLKMTPGNDVIQDVFEKITTVTSKLASDLNRAFGKDVFEPRISRSDGNLETLVGFSGSRGGVFQCKATNEGGDTTVHLTMPNEAQLETAFAAMTDTPRFGDNEFEDPESVDVAGEPVPEYDPSDEVDTEADVTPDTFDSQIAPEEEPTFERYKFLDRKGFHSVNESAEYQKLKLEYAQYLKGKAKRLLKQYQEAAMMSYTIVMKDRRGEQTTSTIEAANENDAKKMAKELARSSRSTVISVSAHIAEADEYKVKPAKKLKAPPVSILPDTEEESIEQADANIAADRSDFKKRTKVNEKNLLRKVKQGVTAGKRAERVGGKLAKGIEDKHMNLSKTARNPNSTQDDLENARGSLNNRINRARRTAAFKPNHINRRISKGMKGAIKEAYESAYVESIEAEQELLSFATKFSKFTTQTVAGDTVRLKIKAEKDEIKINLNAACSKESWKINVTVSSGDDKNSIKITASKGELRQKTEALFSKLLDHMTTPEPVGEVEEEVAANSVSGGGVNFAPNSVGLGNKKVKRRDLPEFVTLRPHGMSGGPFK